MFINSVRLPRKIAKFSKSLENSENFRNVRSYYPECKKELNLMMMKLQISVKSQKTQKHTTKSAQLERIPLNTTIIKQYHLLEFSIIILYTS